MSESTATRANAASRALVRSYDELGGGRGPSIHYRTERFPARQLLKRVDPVLLVDGTGHRVHDLSMNGLSFITAAPDTFREGQDVRIGVKVGDADAFSGAGVVARIEPASRGFLVGLRLTEGFLDIPKLRALHDEIDLRHELETGTRDLLAAVPPGYRRVCADVVHLLRHAQDVLDRYEALLAPHGPAGSERMDEVLDKAVDRFRPEWNALRSSANELISAVLDEPSARAAAKRFTEAVVTPDFMVAPNWRRCYEKPLGYPGDYEIMNYLYSGVREGPTAFARLVHQYGLEQPIAACVPPRMRMIRDMIGRIVREAREGPVQVSSIGCGPAREVQEYLALGRPDRPVHFHLVDQDEQALSFAYRQVFPAASHAGYVVHADLYHVSFVQMLKNPDVFAGFHDQHFIYSAGLFDYLKQDQARLLVASLFAALRPGGTLLIGNMKAPSIGMWDIEFVLDWPLLYRTRAEMLDLLARVKPAAVELDTDPTGVTWMLCARRP